jgi:cytochrome P450
VSARLAGAVPPLPAAAIADELIPLAMAAQEPDALALTWVLDRLARAPGLALRFGAPAPGDDVRDAVLRETLRLRPPAVGVLRRLTGSRTVAGHALPAGVVVMLPIPLLHRDPRAFPEPGRFRPERWASGAPPEGAYLPFGGGARRCLGEHLARACVDTVVPAVLRAVSLRPIGREPERMVLRATTLVPQRGGLVIAGAPALLRPGTPPALRGRGTEGTGSSRAGGMLAT